MKKDLKEIEYQLQRIADNTEIIAHVLNDMYYEDEE